jgi:hypothetical protein
MICSVQLKSGLPRSLGLDFQNFRSCSAQHHLPLFGTQAKLFNNFHRTAIPYGKAVAATHHDTFNAYLRDDELQRTPRPVHCQFARRILASEDSKEAKPMKTLGEPGRTRTYNPLIKSQSLWPCVAYAFSNLRERRGAWCNEKLGSGDFPNSHRNSTRERSM